MPNRLAAETSPYLRQHADNPVDWHPWGEEALERAREEEKPILLSIGYSSCHWCHVMEEESFEDPATARLMNEHFIPVKVDREERPDLDSVYMSAVQGMTGRGGWPLTVFLTPDGVPFYGGTYFPREARQGMPSFRQVLSSAARAWEERREEVESSAEELREALESSVAPEEPAELTPELLDEAYRFAERRFDARRGGFGSAPKFPQPLVLEFLLRHHARTGERRPLQMVEETLDAMARGGIRDHLAGGFHRYAVDEEWLVPHFEKMLYDNALLARIYAEAWQATGEERHRRVAEETAGWLLADFRSPEGAFYSALDADSEGEEGRHYVWTPAEIREVLGPDAAALVLRHYDVTEEGNFEGRNVLHVPHDPGAVARIEGIEPEEARDRLADARGELRRAREERELPFRDEKILADWNGLAIRSLAEAGFALGREGWVSGAREAASFLLEALRPEGRLLHTWKDGEAKIPAFLADHAALGNALLSLWEVTGEVRWLDGARWLAAEAEERFWDDGAGLFFDAPADAESLVVRPRDETDSATPSGSSQAAELLLRLALHDGDDDARELGVRALEGTAGKVERYPMGFGRLLSAVDLHLFPATEIVVAEGPDGGAGALLDEVRARFLPRRILARVRADAGELPDTPLLRGREPVDGRAAAYVCEDYACRRPVTGPGALGEMLDERRAAERTR